MPDLPFVTLSSSDRTIKVETTDLKHSGVYKIELFATPKSPCFGATMTTLFELEMVNLCKTTKFYDQSIANMIVFKQDPEFKPQQVILFDDFKYEAL